MFQLNPTNSDQLARSVQHDYRQAAQNYRLSTESGYWPSIAQTVARVSAIVVTLAITAIAIAQTAVL